jgi:hypothetical protein
MKSHYGTFGTLYEDHILQTEDKFYEEKYATAMGSCLSPLMSNIFVENFEQLALAQHTISLRYG